MRKFRILAAIFAFAALAGCTDVGPTAPQDGGAESDWRGFIGSGS